MRAAEVKTVTMTGLAVLGLALGLAVTGCGEDTTEASGETTAPTTLEVERPTTPIDDVFEVDGVGFHLHCTGQGDTPAGRSSSN
jgi:hypothetical protein